MKYLVRINARAFNPLTRKMDPRKLWEVEQVGNKDSESVRWHSADVRIDTKPIRELYALPKDGEKAWQMECYGVCVRGQDDAIMILTGPMDASGN